MKGLSCDWDHSSYLCLGLPQIFFLFAVISVLSSCLLTVLFFGHTSLCLSMLSGNLLSCSLSGLICKDSKPQRSVGLSRVLSDRISLIQIIYKILESGGCRKGTFKLHFRYLVTMDLWIYRHWSAIDIHFDILSSVLTVKHAVSAFLLFSAWLCWRVLSSWLCEGLDLILPEHS